jgi:hypothetical protein
MYGAADTGRHTRWLEAGIVALLSSSAVEDGLYDYCSTWELA